MVGEGTGPVGEGAWQHFVRGEFDEIVDPGSAAVEDNVWHQRNPFTHAVIMYLRNFSETTGRASPAEFFWGCIIGAICTAAVLGSAWWAGLLAPVATGWMVLIAIPLACGAIRRVHDGGKTGHVLLRKRGWIHLLSESDRYANEFGGPSLKYVGPVGDRLYRRPGR